METKFLHIQLNEYATLEELHEVFLTIRKESGNKAILFHSKINAERHISQFSDVFKHTRVFYYVKQFYIGYRTFLMHEIIID